MSTETSPKTSTPLCVDLDGTLARVDTFHEQAIRAFESWNLLAGLLRRVGAGRASIKQHLADSVPIVASQIPYHRGLIEWLTAEKARGRRLVLVTAADRANAEVVSRHLGLFDEVLASDGTTNLKGKVKADYLVERFGEHGFAYAGNDRSDVAVWMRAHSAIPVAASRSVQRAAARSAPIECSFPREGGSRIRALLREMRPRQWSENLLVFVPQVTARAFLDTSGWGRSCLAFGAFCALASSAYLLNDLADLTADRGHPSKNSRPLAAGELNVVVALALALVLGALGLVLAKLSGAFGFGAAYLVITVLYSTVLKTLAIVDIFTLGAIYTIRVIAGGEASHNAVSVWLLAFSGFLFLALGSMKRVVELRGRDQDGGEPSRRPYQSADVRFLEMLGIGSSVASAVVLALYAQAMGRAGLRHSGEVLLWLVSPVMLFLQMRLWLSTFRGVMLEEPVSYAKSDWVTRLVGILLLVLFALSGMT